MTLLLLQLYLSNLERSKKKYCQKLGFDLIVEKEDSFTIQTGESQLQFTHRGHVNSYHFAFNISYRDIHKALTWLKTRMEILYEEHEVQDFVNWSAQAIYFYDPDGDIVEFIGRRNLNLPQSSCFDASSIVCLSEMGLPCTDIRSIYNTLSQQLGLEIYDCNLHRFCAIGDEHGFFITVNRLKKKELYSTGDPVLEEDFTLKLTHGGTSFKIQKSRGDFNCEILE